MSPKAFLKRSFKHAEMVDLLRSRGLTIADEQTCLQTLKWIGYYRLTGYMQAHQRGGTGPDRHRFFPGTDFSDILAAYSFDCEFRQLALRVLERIEIALRAVMTDVLSNTIGPFWYKEPSVFHPKFDLSAFISELKEAIGHDVPSRRTLSIEHFYAAYNDPDMPPAWMIFETLSFGAMARTIRGLSPHYRGKIASQFNIGEPILMSWVLSLSYTRNLCAHHQRFWNRTFTIKPRVMTMYSNDLTPNHTLYAQLITMQILLRSIDAKGKLSSSIAELFLRYPEISPDDVRFPQGWQSRPVWR